MLVVLLLPGGRQAIAALGSVCVGLAVLVAIFMVGWIIVRLLRRPTDPEGFSLDVVTPTLAPPLSTPIQKPQQHPESTGQLIKEMRSLDWFQFEKLIGAIYHKLGYAVTRRGGANPDGGIDLIVEKHGERSAIQCKQWKTWNVGVRAVREFLGALTDAGIQKGIFVTLCGYSGEAKQLAEKHGIEIVNETGLAKLLEAVDARFDPEMLAILRDTRKVCPKCESNMVLRTATKGPGAGQKFWGCSAYPRCRFTMPVT